METKQLEFVQAIIARLAGNSFQLKAWNVALATAAIGFAAAKDAKPWFAVLAVLPAMAFWGLDAYYLGVERLYRTLYWETIKSETSSFNLDAGTLNFRGWISAAVSPSVACLHGPMLIVILIVSFLR